MRKRLITTPQSIRTHGEGCADRFTELRQGLSNLSDADVSNTLTPKGLTSESLSYHKKDPRAENARSPILSLKEVLKEKTVPQQSTRAELDARRKELLLQAERIKRDYPAKGTNPGKVWEMKPQEATA